MGAGVLTQWITPELADEVAAEARAAADGQVRAAGGTPPRQRFRALPARLGIYFVLGLCLYSHLPYAQVVRELASGLAGRWRRWAGRSRRPPR